MTFGLTGAEIEKILDEIEADIEKNIESIWKRDVSTVVKERETLALLMAHLGRLSVRLLRENNARWENALRDAGVLH
jgi:hypothetical protein